MKMAASHLLSGNELTAAEIKQLLIDAEQLKRERDQPQTLLKNKYLALIFDKPSLRTRFSFTIAMQELGGNVIESAGQTRKSEEPEDQMRVLQGYCHAVMIRTYEDNHLERMKSVATIPIINGLSNLYHPCQTLADLMTLQEKFNTLSGLTVSYLGDGNNVLNSLLLMATKMGINVHYSCPEKFQPHTEILHQIQKNPGKAQAFSDPLQAVKNSDAVYTDVWTSMGFESKDESAFSNYQVNEALMSHAKKEAIFMHCMPMNRGKEVSHTLPDQPCSMIFQQSENRLHVQKALLVKLLT